MSRKLVLSQHIHDFCRAECRPSRETIRKSKEYLKANRATVAPPALAAVHGLTSPPFSLYPSIGFDKLHAVDLRIARDIADKAYVIFSSPSYNKRVLSKMALVRIANQRFKDLPRSCAPSSLSPFRSSQNEKHANMTVALRRGITLMLWIVLVVLQANSKPDKDMILTGCLLLNQY